VLTLFTQPIAPTHLRTEVQTDIHNRNITASVFIVESHRQGSTPTLRDKLTKLFESIKHKYEQPLLTHHQ